MVYPKMPAVFLGLPRPPWEYKTFRARTCNWHPQEVGVYNVIDKGIPTTNGDHLRFWKAALEGLNAIQDPKERLRLFRDRKKIAYYLNYHTLTRTYNLRPGQKLPKGAKPGVDPKLPTIKKKTVGKDAKGKAKEQVKGEGKAKGKGKGGRSVTFSEQVEDSEGEQADQSSSEEESPPPPLHDESYMDIVKTKSPQWCSAFTLEDDNTHDALIAATTKRTMAKRRRNSPCILEPGSDEEPPKQIERMKDWPYTREDLDDLGLDTSSDYSIDIANVDAELYREGDKLYRLVWTNHIMRKNRIREILNQIAADHLATPTSCHSSCINRKKDLNHDFFATIPRNHVKRKFVQAACEWLFGDEGLVKFGPNMVPSREFELALKGVHHWIWEGAVGKHKRTLDRRLELVAKIKETEKGLEEIPNTQITRDQLTLATRQAVALREVNTELNVDDEEVVAIARFMATKFAALEQNVFSMAGSGSQMVTEDMALSKEDYDLALAFFNDHFTQYGQGSLPQ